MDRWQSIITRTLQGNRLQDDEALELLTQGDLPALGQAADVIRQKKHPGPYITFIVDRNINYTNVCKSQCKFCAFYRAKDAGDAYVLNTAELYEKIAETIAAGGTQIMLQGGLHPELTLDYFENMLRGIKAQFPITIHSFSPAEIVHMAGHAGITVQETLRRLQAAGLDSLPGGGAEILDDEVRQRVSPLKITAQQWLDVMESAQRMGMGTTATMVIGLQETYQQRINHFRSIRELQDRTGGFRGFIMWTFQPGNTELGGEKTSAWDYLRTLAVARLYLDNISHLQGSWVTQGQSIGQLTLAFGADDLGSIMLEENVVRAAGTAYQMSIDKMADLIRATGKIPAQRDTKYEILKTF
ncbi:cyclic dehypoxanthinyl futalosine synthase [Sporomusa malonica]|uniref:Cyclic dehypoxanthine futalosine synthase n=1 Tax=Sporomusa malonica TaxID=112901 RepID=A0A1W2E740_9FIRM|nr:cyclic dehypoxanthinyl futalosine synthase [Sporomusa malonica]SMD05146.1 de-hypoxanthine futalosine cyclase [Sporomusa malonica]